MDVTIDPEILKQIKEGNPDAIKLVKEPLRNITIRLLKKYGIRNMGLADEIVMDVFSEIVLRRKPFPVENNVMGFLRTLSNNLICKHLMGIMHSDNNYEDLNNYLDIYQYLDQSVPMWELDDAIEHCLKLLVKKERELMMGLLAGKPSDELVKQFKFKNNEVLYTRSCQVKAKFRKLLKEQGVDFL
jgi:DNA-directed RNA polymerase specialized sigma24 family protein